MATKSPEVKDKKKKPRFLPKNDGLELHLSPSKTYLVFHKSDKDAYATKILTKCPFYTCGPPNDTVRPPCGDWCPHFDLRFDDKSKPTYILILHCTGRRMLLTEYGKVIKGKL